MSCKINFINSIKKISIEDPLRKALVFDDGNKFMTYAELDDMSSFVSFKLHKLGIKAGDSVVVMMERDAYSIVAEVGVFKSGAVFVPVLPSYPKERIDYIIKDCNAKYVLKNDFFKDYKKIDEDIVYYEPNPEMVMIVYTSGSTGHPKGVVYDLNAYNYAIYRLSPNYDKINPIVYAGFAPMAFIAHLNEYPTVFNLGGTTHIISNKIRMNAISLEKYYIDNNITVGFMSVGVLNLFKRKMPSVQRIFLGGEKISALDPKGYDILNIYAQTEAMHMCTFRIDGYHKESYIGKSVLGTETFILDENGKDVGFEQPGEICVKGFYPKKYLNLEESSKNTFEILKDEKVLVHTGDIGIRHSSGIIEYLNRKDFMVKINGNRVDPSEIELAIKSIKSIENVIVKAFTSKSGKTYFCAYYISKDNIDDTFIKEVISKKLPDYMIPSRYVKMDSFPLNDNGKIDRKSLKEPKSIISNTDNYVAPQTDNEIRICNIIKKVLKVSKIGLNDNIISYGIDSLQITLLLSMLFEAGFGVIETKQVYDNPIISDLIKCILNSKYVGYPEYTILSKGKKGNSPLVFFHTANMGSIAYKTIKKSLPKNIPFMCFENHNLNYPEMILDKITTLAKYYRLVGYPFFSHFKNEDPQDIIYAGWSFGGSVALESVLISESKGENVKGLILIDPFIIEEKDRESIIKFSFDPNLKKYFNEGNIETENNNLDWLFRNNQLCVKMLANYVPSGTTNVRTLFLKSKIVRDTDITKSKCHHLPANGFEKYCKNLEIVEVDCNHDEMLKNQKVISKIIEFINSLSN